MSIAKFLRTPILRTYANGCFWADYEWKIHYDWPKYVSDWILGQICLAHYLDKIHNVVRVCLKCRSVGIPENLNSERMVWTFGLWTVGRLDSGQLVAGRVDSGRLDYGRLDAWTLDAWTLGLWTIGLWMLGPRNFFPFLVLSISFFLVFNEEFLNISKALRVMALLWLCWTCSKWFL